MTEHTEESGWLLVSVSTAGAAPTLRVQVWRKLRSLGALYLQQSVCLLPEREHTVRQVRRLLDRVRQQGGTGRMLHLALTDPAEERQVIGEFSAARDAEYAEVLERLPAFRAELAHERERGRATYAEVEESEADLERFRSWMGKIAARDYFAAPGGAAARAALEEAAADLAAFEQAALAAEAPTMDTDTAAPKAGRSRMRASEEKA
ncbi:Chromate resistance protein ChrB [Nonomuraea jabiensis]|uniref:Chromate resistance protein ChrB n=1 Tax=Nonomuraea jabiensis TaxID=882448 RepID=UPI003D717D55